MPLEIGKFLPLALLLVVGLTLAAMIWQRASAPEAAGVLLLEGRTMGSSYRISLRGPVEAADSAALEEAVAALLQRLDKQVFSTWAESSELSRFNRVSAPVQWTASKEMLEVTALAREAHTLSAGAFDPTIGPLVDLWGFGPAFTGDRIPTEESIAGARQLLGFADLREDGARGTLSKHRDLSLDYSGIAKGYAVDRIGALLEEHGFLHYLVEIGGEILVRGERAAGQEWRIGIEAPQDGGPSLFRALGNRGERVAVAVSGNYRNYFDHEGRRYSHLIDPLTGWPVRHVTVSATVLHPSTALADALATALIVMGPDRAKVWAVEQDMAVHLILQTEAGYESWHSPGLEGYLRAGR